MNKSKDRTHALYRFFTKLCQEKKPKKWYKYLSTVQQIEKKYLSTSKDTQFETMMNVKMNLSRTLKF